MLKKILFSMAGTVAVGLVFAGSAEAIVIDFDSLEQAGNSLINVPGNTYTEDGFTISGAPMFYVQQSSNLYAGSAGVHLRSGGATTTLFETSNGDPFNLNSIDLSILNPNGSSPPINFIGTLLGGGTVSQTFTPTSFGFNTFTFSSNFSNLISVAWNQGSSELQAHQYDNINIESVQSIPEPVSSFSFLVFGIFAAGSTLKKKSAKA